MMLAHEFRLPLYEVRSWPFSEVRLWLKFFEMQRNG